jgi:hypothetical protein
MLTASALRKILDAALGPDAEVAGHIAALQQQRLWPIDESSRINTRAAVIVLLALLSGEQPDKAPSEALRIAGFRLSGTTQRAYPCGCRETGAHHGEGQERDRVHRGCIGIAGSRLGSPHTAGQRRRGHAGYWAQRHCRCVADGGGKSGVGSGYC